LPCEVAASPAANFYTSVLAFAQVRMAKPGENAQQRRFPRSVGAGDGDESGGRHLEGRVAQTVHRAGYVLQVLVSPNKAVAPDSFALRITKGGQPVRGANVTLTFNHTEMQMPQQEYQLTETGPGVYSRAAPALVMVGKWALDFQITPKSGLPFTALILDQADG